MDFLFRPSGVLYARRALSTQEFRRSSVNANPRSCTPCANRHHTICLLDFSAHTLRGSEIRHTFRPVGLAYRYPQVLPLQCRNLPREINSARVLPILPLGLRMSKCRSTGTKDCLLKRSILLGVAEVPEGGNRERAI